jgi:hypothetical protein
MAPLIAFDHAEPPDAGKNLAFSGTKDNLHLRLMVTKMRSYSPFPSKGEENNGNKALATI